MMKKYHGRGWRTSEEHKRAALEMRRWLGGGEIGDSDVGQTRTEKLGGGESGMEPRAARGQIWGPGGSSKGENISMRETAEGSSH